MYGLFWSQTTTNNTSLGLLATEWKMIDGYDISEKAYRAHIE